MISDLYISEVRLKKEIPRNNYLYSLPVIKSLKKNKELKLKSKVTIIVGENGTGKSTLIEAIAVAFGFNPEGGTKNFNFQTAQAHSDLHEYITLSKGLLPKDGFFLRAESYFNLASNIEELDKGGRSPRIIDSYGGVSLHEQSHGESFLSLVQNRFGGNGIYILDEPEAALSPMRIMTLMAEMDYLVKRNSQFIIATHSPILMAFPMADIIEITKEGIKNVGYQETEHFRVTKSFLNNPEKMLHYLLDK